MAYLSSIPKPDDQLFFNVPPPKKTEGRYPHGGEDKKVWPLNTAFDGLSPSVQYGYQSVNEKVWKNFLKKRPHYRAGEPYYARTLQYMRFRYITAKGQLVRQFNLRFELAGGKPPTADVMLEKYAQAYGQLLSKDEDFVALLHETGNDILRFHSGYDRILGDNGAKGDGLNIIGQILMCMRDILNGHRVCWIPVVPKSGWLSFFSRTVSFKWNEIQPYHDIRMPGDELSRELDELYVVRQDIEEEMEEIELELQRSREEYDKLTRQESKAQRRLARLLEQSRVEKRDLNTNDEITALEEEIFRRRTAEDKAREALEDTEKLYFYQLARYERADYNPLPSGSYDRHRPVVPLYDLESRLRVLKNRAEEARDRTTRTVTSAEIEELRDEIAELEAQISDVLNARDKIDARMAELMDDKEEIEEEISEAEAHPVFDPQKQFYLGTIKQAQQFLAKLGVEVARQEPQRFLPARKEKKKKRPRKTKPKTKTRKPKGTPAPRPKRQTGPPPPPKRQTGPPPPPKRQTGPPPPPKRQTGPPPPPPRKPPPPPRKSPPPPGFSVVPLQIDRPAGGDWQKLADEIWNEFVDEQKAQRRQGGKEVAEDSDTDVEEGEVTDVEGENVTETRNIPPSWEDVFF